MKIAILTEILSTHSGSRAPIELAKYLSLNNEVTLVAYDLKTEREVKIDLEKKGVKVVLITPHSIPFGKWLAALKILPYLKENEIISFHGTLPTFFAAKISGLPIIKTYYGTQLDAYLEKLLPSQKPKLQDKLFNWFGNQLILLIEKVYFRLADQTVGISRYTANEAERLHQKHISFIYLGASRLTLKNPPEADRRRTEEQKNLPAGRQGKKEKAVTILSVSRITPYKGFHHLIEAVRGLEKEVKLIIAGSAAQPEYLTYLDKIKGPNTQILTDVSDQALADLYQNCDLYVAADRYLFFGLPPLEAALFGKPSLTLNHCAASEIVQHGKTGFVAQSLKEFKNYLKMLIDNPKLGQSLGRQAKNWAQNNFSWEKTAKVYQKLFEHEKRR